MSEEQYGREFYEGLIDKLDRKESEAALPSIDEVDDRAVKLIEEFADYHDQVKRTDVYRDRQSTFEGWIIQKLAALQLAVEAQIS
jgi:hypothetical protein